MKKLKCQQNFGSVKRSRLLVEPAYFSQEFEKLSAGAELQAKIQIVLVRIGRISYRRWVLKPDKYTYSCVKNGWLLTKAKTSRSLFAWSNCFILRVSSLLRTFMTQKRWSTTFLTKCTQPNLPVPEHVRYYIVSWSLKCRRGKAQG